ncbi:DNA-directed RNA polymerase [Pseudomonas phage MiCath]|uniref:DNA-directed RNA polymerase n=1 Tax=Pseudomonas phage MiCath TaxID=3003729 RepID=A0AAE9VLI5_9CAUD|nr:DNA-directed RNA polymerase [Pseudomonas phage MiCath]WAX22367.1 DNA-directed RNA polymerase [Pseudomonas phage MiCath]
MLTVRVRCSHCRTRHKFKTTRQHWQCKKCKLWDFRVVNDGPTCDCSAYTFPHRRGGGKCCLTEEGMLPDLPGSDEQFPF